MTKETVHARRVHKVRPDRVDLRDRIYQPSIRKAPALALPPSHLPARVRDQGETQACTGYALAAAVEMLMARAKREEAGAVSAGMLYSMARRYDEFEGDDDSGSSLRGALKGWFRHGACAEALWKDALPADQMPPASEEPEQDWWRDALRRPLGAYYRVAKGQLADMHSALDETGLVYASALIHPGWSSEALVKRGTGKRPVWDIPFEPADGATGHAFVIVGYDQTGFLVFNSWGRGWGHQGIARLSYDDWLTHAMDAWVVQLGVPTAEREVAAKRSTLQLHAANGVRRVSVAGEPVVRDHELGAFIVNAGNDGRLSDKGRFRTQLDDLKFLLGHHLRAFRAQHGLPDAAPVDIGLYAHGGLVDESAAASTAARWVPALYAARVFPIFLMWETGFGEIIDNLIEDAFRREPAQPARAGGIKDWFDTRLERALSRMGGAVWSKMKRNGAGATLHPIGALRLLFELGLADGSLAPGNARLHLIGHSAGSIVHAELAAWLLSRGCEIASLSFMAPALRLDRFAQLVQPQLGTTIHAYRSYCLSDQAERADPTVPVYTKSLLYLVSRSFEGEREVPLVGMDKHLPAALLTHPAVTHHVASPNGVSRATTHGGFDDDLATIASVIGSIAHAPILQPTGSDPEGPPPTVTQTLPKAAAAGRAARSARRKSR